jgi:hypothetical protein
LPICCASAIHDCSSQKSAARTTPMIADAPLSASVRPFVVLLNWLYELSPNTPPPAPKNTEPEPTRPITPTKPLECCPSTSSVSVLLVL